MSDLLLKRLARRRVRLGFVTALVALAFAAPTWVSWQAGLLIAIAGEVLRVWAAGHLNKAREVTRSGPYRFVPHPLYVGSGIMAIGAVVAARSVVVGVVIAVYMAVTITAAVLTEEADLRRAFGSAYDDYRASTGTPAPRAFSLERVRRNREYRALLGLGAGFGLLALKLISLI